MTKFYDYERRDRFYRNRPSAAIFHMKIFDPNGGFAFKGPVTTPGHEGWSRLDMITWPAGRKRRQLDVSKERGDRELGLGQSSCK